MQESYLNRDFMNQSEHEIFSKLQVPPETPFFARLDGWRFQAISNSLNVEKPFDTRFAKCLVASGKAIFQSSFNPALIYIASDELNVLFLKENTPFKRRVEKINSLLAGIASSAFSTATQELFGKSIVVSFDSRVVATSKEKIWVYLVWRQNNAWRNHNNAYAYWLFRRLGYQPSEAAKKIKGLKTKDLHETLFQHGINLSQTPAWQRRGILLYKVPYKKQTEKGIAIRHQLKEDWKLPLFSSETGKMLIQRLIEEKTELKKEGKGDRIFG